MSTVFCSYLSAAISLVWKWLCGFSRAWGLDMRFCRAFADFYFSAKREMYYLCRILGECMRSGLAVLVCGLVLLTGCGSSSPTVQPPVANAGGSYTGTVGTAVSFSGAASTDPQNQTLTYAWNFGDNSTGIGVSPTHTYAVAGTYTVSLTATNTSNLSNTATSKATITPGPPVANAGGPYTGMVGTAVSFSGAGSSDPQGQTLTYAWSFGDSSMGTGATPTHTYAAPGTYTVSLTVTNTSNLTATATSKATIAAAALLPPVANAGGPYTGATGVAVSFSGAASSDLQGETLSYAWNFGDNSTGTGATPTHTYATSGTYTVSLTVTNTSNLSNTATSKATIAAQPPIANAGGPYAATVGATIQFSGATSSDPQGETLAYDWSFGDNATATGVNPTHMYATPGTYTVSLTVVNSSNLKGTATSKATIASLGPGNGNGVVYDGHQPIVGSHVHLMAAGATGYGQPSVSLLSASQTGYSDASGAYILTGADGSFNWPTTYSCSPGTQIYIYASGGTTGNGTNSAIGLMATLGACPTVGNFNAIQYIWVNEVTTVATAYALAGFATDATHISSSGTPLASVGVANAFANAANLASLASGIALQTTPAGNGLVPQTTINTLANILSACVATNGPTSGPCSTLFSLALSQGASGASPKDTATAAINIAHNPGINVAALYAIPGTSPQFAPALTYPPEDLTISLQFGVGGNAIAIDQNGNVWISDPGGILELSSTGVLLSPPPYGYRGGTVGNFDLLSNIAIDASGNVWVAGNPDIIDLPSMFAEFSNSGAEINQYVAPGQDGIGLGLNTTGGTYFALDGNGNLWAANNYNSALEEFSISGTVLSQTGAYTTGGINGPFAVAIDAHGNAWAANFTGNSVTEVSSSSSVLSPSTGFTASQLAHPEGIAVDANNCVWVASNGALSKFSNSGVLISQTAADTGLTLDGYPVAIDGAGNVWLSGGGVSEVSNTGAVLNPLAYGPTGLITHGEIAVDGSGDVWVTSGLGSIYEFIGPGVPVVTPISVGVKNNMLGTRP
jgi:PKD repeat protein